MSGGPACNCGERAKPIADRAWVVWQYRVACSAFNGYRAESSNYSGVVCWSCKRVWRTAARYVDRLPTGKLEDAFKKG